MIHSLDNAANTLKDKKSFGSRLEIDSSCQKYLQSIIRRLYRILSHTYFHHEEVFHECESKNNLCRRFTFFARHFKMMSNDLFIIPDEAI